MQPTAVYESFSKIIGNRYCSTAEGIITVTKKGRIYGYLETDDIKVRLSNLKKAYIIGKVSFACSYCLYIESVFR